MVYSWNPYWIADNWSSKPGPAARSPAAMDWKIRDAKAPLFGIAMTVVDWLVHRVHVGFGSPKPNLQIGYAGDLVVEDVGCGCAICSDVDRVQR